MTVQLNFSDRTLKFLRAAFHPVSTEERADLLESLEYHHSRRALYRKFNELYKRGYLYLPTPVSSPLFIIKQPVRFSWFLTRCTLTPRGKHILDLWSRKVAFDTELTAALEYRDIPPFDNNPTE